MTSWVSEMKKGVRKVAGVAGELKNSIRYHIDLITLRREIERLFSELGGRTFELLSHDPESSVHTDPEVLEWMEKLKELDVRLRSHKEERKTSSPEE